MSHIDCPHCRATLDAEQLRASARPECPFCGVELENQLFADREDAAFQASPQVGTAATNLPSGSQIQVVETDQSRMVFFIPAGGKRVASLGWFALFWNGLITAVTIAFLSAPKDVWTVVLVLAVFWLVGLFLAGFWLRMRFTRSFLLLESDRLSIQRHLFGYSWLKTAIFGDKTEAKLVEAYRENDVSVYCVAVEGVNRTIKFGTALSSEEKHWFVATINSFLGISAALPTPSVDTSPSRIGKQVPELSPSELRPDSGVTIDEEASGRLVLHYTALVSGRVRNTAMVVAAACLLFSIGIFCGVVFATMPKVAADPGFGWFPLLITVPFMIPGACGLFTLLFVFYGQITIDVSERELCYRWHLGRIGIRKTIPINDISDIRIAPMTMRYSKNGVEQSTSILPIENSYLVTSGKPIPLTVNHGRDVSLIVGGLIRHRLAELGVGLPNE